MTDAIASPELTARFDQLRELLTALRQDMRDRFDRHVPLADLLFDRWDTARFYGFGEGTSCYNNVLILGDVQVGRHCWIGPNVILDGSGGLKIGDHCSISAGVQIYSHHTVRQSTSMGVVAIDRLPTTIGDGVYIGPGSVIQMGCSVGDRSVVGAMSLVNRDVPSGTKCYGVPGRIHGDNGGTRRAGDDG